MIFILDIRSVILQTAITHAFFTIILVVFNLQKTRIKGLDKLTKGCFFIFMGLILIICRGILPNYLTITVANCLMICGIMLLSHGTRVFSKSSEKLFKIELLSIVPFVLLFIYFSHYNPNINARIVVFASYTIYFQYKMMEAIIYQKEEIIKHISYLICFFIALSSLFEIYKVFSALMGPNLHTYFQAGNHEGVRLILIQLGHFILIMGVFLISSKIYENELKIQSMADSLTGLLNRKAFDQLTNMQIAKAERDNKKIGLAICDIDNFKSINDSYGHSVGDEIIIKFANLIKDNLRTYDLLGRYGGDEFTILIPEIEKPEIILKLENIRNKIEKNHFVINGEKININASFGALVFSPGDVDIKKAFNIADSALYEAKNLGRNKAVVKS